MKLKDFGPVFLALAIILITYFFLWYQGYLNKEKVEESFPAIKKIEPIAKKIKSIIKIKEVSTGNKKSIMDIKKGEKYQSDSGLKFEVLELGNGDRPQSTDVVKVHYKGYLEDGFVFDSSYKRGEPASFPLNQVIAGWTEGLQYMPVGSKFKITIKPELAYGDRELPGIPANSILIFEVELLDIIK